MLRHMNKKESSHMSFCDCFLNLSIIIQMVSLQWGISGSSVIKCVNILYHLAYETCNSWNRPDIAPLVLHFSPCHAFLYILFYISSQCMPIKVALKCFIHRQDFPTLNIRRCMCFIDNLLPKWLSYTCGLSIEWKPIFKRGWTKWFAITPINQFTHGIQMKCIQREYIWKFLLIGALVRGEG